MFNTEIGHSISSPSCVWYFQSEIITGKENRIKFEISWGGGGGTADV